MKEMNTKNKKQLLLWLALFIAYVAALQLYESKFGLFKISAVYLILSLVCNLILNRFTKHDLT